MNRFRRAGTYEADRKPVSLEITAIKRNAITLWIGATCILGVVGPAKSGEDMNAVVYALAIVGSAGMLVVGMSLLYRAISKLEKENVELRNRLSALERPD